MLPTPLSARKPTARPLFALTLLALLPSCYGMMWRPARNCDTEFWRKSREEQHEIVAGFPLEKQFVYHQQRRDCIYPGDSFGFERELAAHGDATLAFLKKTLEESTDAETVYDVAGIVLYMHSQDGTYDAALMDLLRARVSSLRRGYYREGAERRIRVIEEGPGILLPDLVPDAEA